MRELFADKDIDAVSIATPNHWHALATIWACQAGKDVYVEKPASYNVHESWRMVEVARQTKRMVQVGSQSRSMPQDDSRHATPARRARSARSTWRRACASSAANRSARRRWSRCRPGLDWGEFLGPAPMRPYTKNRFAYNWHWFWDTGNGDIGNQGIHQMDICRWGMGDVGMPKSAFSTGGKYVYDDDQETPNTQLATLDYGGKEIVFEVRGILTGPEAGNPVKGGNAVGNIFLGSDGWMWASGSGFRVYKGEKNEQAMEDNGKSEEDTTVLHMRNFLAACRSRNHQRAACRGRDRRARPRRWCISPTSATGWGARSRGTMRRRASSTTAKRPSC